MMTDASEVFTISVDFKLGLEPQKLTVNAYYDLRAAINSLFVFEIVLDGKAVAVLIPAEGSWCQAEGALSPRVVRRIGLAIEEYYDLVGE
jgi:hypothetical protein